MMDFITEADYREGEELELIVKTAINKMAVSERLTRLHKKHKRSIT